MQFLQTVLVHSMWNYDPANYWICSLYDIQLFRFLFFFICVETPRGRCSIFHWFKLQNKSASLVLLIRLDYFLLRRMLLHQSAATVSVDCIVVRRFRKLSHSVVSGLNSHSRCSHTPSTNAIGHSVCGFSLHDSKKATATPSKPPPPPAVAICRNPRQNFARIEGMICLECRTNEENEIDTFSSWRCLFICLYMDIYSKLPESRLIVIYLKWGQIHCNQCETFFTRTHVFFSLSLSVPSLLTRG